MIFFLECPPAEREGERERERETERERERDRERVDRTYAGVNLVFSGFLNDPRRDKRDSRCR